MPDLTPEAAARLSPLVPGQQVIWRHWTRGGWGYLEKVPATVVRIGKSRVTIDAAKAGGGTKRISVMPVNIEIPEEPKPC